MKHSTGIVQHDAGHQGTAPQSGMNDGGKLLYIERLKEIYKRKSGEEITDAQALILFEQLISLVKAVYQPIAKKTGI